MTLVEVFAALGKDRFDELLRLVSIGSVKTYRVYESLKIHARLSKVNRERLRKAAPQLWSRLAEQNDEDLAREIAQAVIVSHLAFVAAALDSLDISHDGNGFYDKDEALADKLKDGWREGLLSRFRAEYPESLILLYINHLDWELGTNPSPFLG